VYELVTGLSPPEPAEQGQAAGMSPCKEDSRAACPTQFDTRSAPDLNGKSAAGACRRAIARRGGHDGDYVAGQRDRQIEAINVTAAQDIKEPARRACRIELAAGLLDEGAYAEARDLLKLAQAGPADPPPEKDPLHRTWLHKTVMAYRRLGEETENAAEQRELWDEAKRFLLEAEAGGYRDSETYGIWGGLLKRQLEKQRAGMDKAVAQSLFAEMEQRYRSGFDLDPDYYPGVNVVMALRWSGRPRHDAFHRDFVPPILQ
jgi:hypothetical protein